MLAISSLCTFQSLSCAHLELAQVQNKEHKFKLHRLQSIQNSAAQYKTPALRKLHWLPIQFHSNWLPWCKSLFILVFLNNLLHTYPHTALLTILDLVRVLPISSMYQNFNLKFTSLLSSLASVLPLILPLFGIHFLKTFTHHPLLSLLETSSKPISMQRHIIISSFPLMLFRGADLFLSLDFEL